jgi:transcriptional regulator with XRE-family HTH domain
MGQKRPPDELIEIGNRLRQARESLGLSQVEICEALGVKKVAWNNWENARRIPDPLAMRDLYLQYGISLDQIYVGDWFLISKNFWKLAIFNISSTTSLQFNNVISEP